MLLQVEKNTVIITVIVLLAVGMDIPALQVRGIQITTIGSLLVLVPVHYCLGANDDND